MICFVSNSKQGFIYNVFQKTEFLAHCTYTSETTMAAICNNMLYSVTSQALETYVVPIYAAVAKQMRKMQTSESEDKLSIDNVVVPSDGNATDTLDDVLPKSNDQESSQENKFTHYGFPVYDQEILQKVTVLPENLSSLEKAKTSKIQGGVKICPHQEKLLSATRNHRYNLFTKHSGRIEMPQSSITSQLRENEVDGSLAPY